MEEFPQFTENEDVQGFTSMFFPTTDLPITTTMLPDNSTLHCNSFRKNSTTPIVINAGYGGIPQNLLINFVGGLVMILWSAAVTLVAYILLRYLDMHRASINDETLGLDLAVHNEPAYNFTWEDIEIQFKTANANGKQQK